MKLFISHSHAEMSLAQAWKDLLGALNGEITVWFSSDKDPSGGIGPGRWREKIKEKLDEADVVLGLFTPESENRQWIFFECAYAIGHSDDKEVVPILYYMDESRIPSPLRDRKSYIGDDKEQVLDFCSRILMMQTKEKMKDEERAALNAGISSYLAVVEKHGQKRTEKDLFYSGFHTEETAKKLEGVWYAKWTQLEDGKESIFETDELRIRSTKNRIRIVGKGQKGSLYPMEGVVSSKGHVALSYWSQGEIPICGTCLLELIGANRLMEGRWEGYTARTLDERLCLINGRVVIGRDKAKVDGYWK